MLFFHEEKFLKFKINFVLKKFIKLIRFQTLISKKRLRIVWIKRDNLVSNYRC